jgi:hypothetical protein
VVSIKVQGLERLELRKRASESLAKVRTELIVIEREVSNALEAGETVEQANARLGLDVVLAKSDGADGLGLDDGFSKDTDGSAAQAGVGDGEGGELIMTRKNLGDGRNTFVRNRSAIQVELGVITVGKEVEDASVRSAGLVGLESLAVVERGDLAGDE